MKNSILTCREYCKTEDADLILDYDVCIHQYFCDCYPCPKFQIDTCEMQCNDNGKIAYVNTDHMGCRICDCQCPIINCTDFCVFHMRWFTTRMGAQNANVHVRYWTVI